MNQKIIEKLIEKLKNTISNLEEVITYLNTPPPKPLTRDEICFEGED